MKKFIRNLRIKLIDWLARNDIIVAIGVEFNCDEGIIIRNSKKCEKGILIRGVSSIKNNKEVVVNIIYK